MSHNDITGDRIATKPSKAYEDNYDRIFRRPRSPTRPGCQTLQEVIAELSEGDPEFVRLLEEARKTVVNLDQCCPMCDVVEQLPDAVNARTCRQE